MVAACVLAPFPARVQIRAPSAGRSFPAFEQPVPLRASTPGHAPDCRPSPCCVSPTPFHPSLPAQSDFGAAPSAPTASMPTLSRTVVVIIGSSVFPTRLDTPERGGPVLPDLDSPWGAECPAGGGC